jgi:hypothetical protein
MALSARELATIQADWQANVFDQTLTINRTTNTKGALGNTVETYALVASGVPCYIQEPQETLLIRIAEFVGANRTWVIQVPPGTDVRVNDQIVLASGKLLRVQNLDTGRSYPFTLQFEAADIS